MNPLFQNSVLDVKFCREVLFFKKKYAKMLAVGWQHCSAYNICTFYYHVHVHFNSHSIGSCIMCGRYQKKVYCLYKGMVISVLFSCHSWLVFVQRMPHFLSSFPFCSMHMREHMRHQCMRKGTRKLFCFSCLCCGSTQSLLSTNPGTTTVVVELSHTHVRM